MLIVQYAKNIMRIIGFVSYKLGLENCKHYSSYECNNLLINVQHRIFNY